MVDAIVQSSVARICLVERRDEAQTGPLQPIFLPPTIARIRPGSYDAVCTHLCTLVLDDALEYVVVDTRDGFIGYETGSTAFSRLPALVCLERARPH
jgi:hypothetical protein